MQDKEALLNAIQGSHDAHTSHIDSLEDMLVSRELAGANDLVAANATWEVRKCEVHSPRSGAGWLTTGVLTFALTVVGQVCGVSGAGTIKVPLTATVGTHATSVSVWKPVFLSCLRQPCWWGSQSFSSDRCPAGSCSCCISQRQRSCVPDSCCWLGILLQLTDVMACAL